MDELIHGSADFHDRYFELAPSKSRRRCNCGCGKIATHVGKANGAALTMGCQLYIRRWVRDGFNASTVNNSRRW